MQVIKAIPRRAGDYIYSDENLRIIDETTGESYDLLVKSEEEDRIQTGGRVDLYISADLIEDMRWVDDHCVVQLKKPIDEQDRLARLERLRRKLSRN